MFVFRLVPQYNHYIYSLTIVTKRMSRALIVSKYYYRERYKPLIGYTPFRSGYRVRCTVIVTSYYQGIYFGFLYRRFDSSNHTFYTMLTEWYILYDSYLTKRNRQVKIYQVYRLLNI